MELIVSLSITCGSGFGDSAFSVVVLEFLPACLERGYRRWEEGGGGGEQARWEEGVRIIDWMEGEYFQ